MMAGDHLETSFQQHGLPPAGGSSRPVRGAELASQPSGGGRGALAAGSRAGSLATGASTDLALLSLASSASADLRFRRAESLLPCGLTQDELAELLGRYAEASPAGSRRSSLDKGPSPAAAKIGGGVTVSTGGPAGTGAAGPSSSGSSHS